MAFYFSVCVHMSVCMHLCMCALPIEVRRGYQELELEVVVNYLTWVLGTK